MRPRQPARGETHAYAGSPPCAATPAPCSSPTELWSVVRRSTPPDEPSESPTSGTSESAPEGWFSPTADEGSAVVGLLAPVAVLEVELESAPAESPGQRRTREGNEEGERTRVLVDEVLALVDNLREVQGDGQLSL